MELQNIQNHMLHNFGMQQSTSSSVGSAQDPMNTLYMDCSLSWSESFNYNQDKQYNCPPYQYNSGGITDWYGVQYNSCAVSSGFESFEEPKETLEDSFTQRYSKSVNTSGGFYSNGDLGFSQFSGNGFWPEENWIDTLRGPPILTNSDVSTVLCLPNSPSIPSGQEEPCSDDGSDIIVEESEEESEICISEDVDDWKLGQLVQETLPVQKTLLWCSICGKGFALKRVLTKHIKSHDPDSRLQCEICGRTYSVRHKLTAHLVEVHGTGKTVECKECGRKFRRERNLVAHVKRAHSGEGVRAAVKRHRCPTCDKGFSHPSDLASHQASHSSAKPHSCQVCGRSYKSRSHLNHHRKTKHEQRPSEEADEEAVPVAKKLLCQTCGARFSHKRYLRRHCKEQHEAAGAPSRVECPVCGKRTRASDLKTHLRVHTGEKPYSCDRCGVVFSVKSSLNKHLRLKHPET